MIVLSARTNTQYYSSSFFFGPTRCKFQPGPLENSPLIYRPVGKIIHHLLAQLIGKIILINQHGPVRAAGLACRPLMHIQLRDDPDFYLITYVYSILLLNLLVKDLTFPNIKEQTLFTVNFFRNNHFANAKYGSQGK